MADPRVEAAARALVWEQHQGCVQWDDDPTDTATSGSEQMRRYALAHARAALAAADAVTPADPHRERLEQALRAAEIGIGSLLWVMNNRNNWAHPRWEWSGGICRTGRPRSPGQCPRCPATPR